MMDWTNLDVSRHRVALCRRLRLLAAASILFCQGCTSFWDPLLSYRYFRAAVDFSVGINPQSVAVDDFNRDGKPDLAVANYGSGDVSVLLGNGVGGFNLTATFPVGEAPSSVAVKDFNDDGQLDIVVAHHSGPISVSVLLGDGQGNFPSQVNTTDTVGGERSAVAVGNFDNDSAPDVVVTSLADSEISILLGNGVGGFVSPDPVLSYPAPIPISVAVGHFDSGTTLDLAVANRDANRVSVMLGKSTGGVTPTSPTMVTDVGVRPVSVAVGDFNRDGKADLVVANSNSKDVSVLLGDGTGSFQPVVPNCPVGTSPFFVAVGYFNRDEKVDLVVANNGSNSVSVLLGKGDGHFEDAVTIASGILPFAVAVGDFDGDGKQDLAVVNAGSNEGRNTGSVSVLINQF